MDRRSIKRLQFGETPSGEAVNLYTNYINGLKSGYFIAVERKRVSMFASLDAASTRFTAICAGEVFEFHRDPDVYEQQAKETETDPGRLVTDVRFPLLALLECRAAERRGCNSIHSRMALTVGKAVGGDVIPSDEKTFGAWLEAAIERVSDVPTTSARRIRLGIMRRCLNLLAENPQAFRQYQKVIPQIIARFRTKKLEKMKAGEKIINRKPFTRIEIAECLENCTSFEHAALVVCYLAMGSRPNEAERMNLSHIVNGRLRLRYVQTKTQTSKEPVVPLVVTAILRLIHASGMQFGKVPVQYDRRRFRATCGVFLTLCGVDALTVSTRLGHAGTTMLQNHYVKWTPEDYAAARSGADYLSIGPVFIDGKDTMQNGYDNWLLYLALMQAKRFNIGLKTTVLAEMGAGVATPRQSVNF